MRTLPPAGQSLPCLSGRVLVPGSASGRVVASGTELSFWGGVDPASGLIIDQHHPLNGQSLAGAILVLPGGRGSCTGSAVMLELLMAGHGPAGLVLARPDEILTLGVIVARELFGVSIPVVVLDETGSQPRRRPGRSASRTGGSGGMRALSQERTKRRAAPPIRPADH